MAKTEQEIDHDGDLGDVRAQLKLAQERLATYQKFDRDIAENVRRSSELMLEAMQVRDRMEHDASEQARARQERLSGQLKAMQSELEGVQGQVGAMLERVAALREDIESDSADDVPAPDGDEPPAEVVIPPDAETASEAESSSAEPQDAGEPEAELESQPSASRSIDLIAHGMTRAASALALQSHVRALDQVETVDAREFSSGVLRLQLNLVGDLADEDLLGWEGDDEVTVLRHQDDTIELRIGE